MQRQKAMTPQQPRDVKRKRAVSTRCAFWSGNLKESVVRSTFAHPEKHTRMARAFLAAMSVDTVLREMGRESFILKWPKIRTRLFDPEDREDAKRLRLFDSIWSVWVVGESQFPVSEKVARLSKGRKAILKAVVESPGVSIYQLAKQTRRHYSRVHKDVSLLVEEGFLEIDREKSAAGRKVCSVFAVGSMNAKIFKARHGALIWK